MVNVVNLTNYIVIVNNRYTLYPNNSRLDSKMEIHKRVFNIKLLRRENRKFYKEIYFREFKGHIYILKKYEEYMLDWK